MDIIEINSQKELPKGIEMILYEPPFYGEVLQEVITEFKKKYGNHPQTIYLLDKKVFVLKEKQGK